MRLKSLAICLALLVAETLVTGCTTSRITSFKLETSEAPEVYGINRSLESHNTTLRLHGGIRIDSREDIHVSGQYWDWDEDSLHSQKTFSAQGIYEFGGFEFEGGATWFSKSDIFVLGFGINFNDGLYHNFILGINTDRFEAGIFTGLFQQYSHIAYYGKKCSSLNSCDDDDWELTYDAYDETHISLFYGLYAGIFFGDMFLNYSLSMYTPDLEIEDDIIKVPMVSTNYITLGYRLFNKFEVSGGAVISVIRSKMHLGASLGVNFYPF